MKQKTYTQKAYAELKGVKLARICNMIRKKEIKFKVTEEGRRVIINCKSNDNLFLNPHPNRGKIIPRKIIEK